MGGLLQRVPGYTRFGHHSRVPARWAGYRLYFTHQPAIEAQGPAMVHNPLDRAAKKRLKLPLYYTGLTTTASIREQQGKSKKYELDREYNVVIPVNMAPRSVSWFIVE